MKSLQQRNICNLFHNYPNPFNPTITINFLIPTSEFVTPKVYYVLGKEVATLVDECRDAENPEVEFNPSVGNLQLVSGIYFYRLQTGNFVETKKMILFR